jgi:hypothetical protein
MGVIRWAGHSDHLEIPMSDERKPEPIILPEQPSATPAAHSAPQAHTCEHPGCSKWGSFGFGHDLRQRWYCFEHREDGERSS